MRNGIRMLRNLDSSRVKIKGTHFHKKAVKRKVKKKSKKKSKK